MAMTMAEYADYEAAFAKGMEGLTAFSSGSWVERCERCPEDANYEDGVCYDAGEFFSWHACEICGATDGGSREDAHARLTSRDGQLIHLRVCTDCVYYAEYGRLDDATMAEVE